jgi:hypothetical protein
MDVDVGSDVLQLAGSKATSIKTIILSNNRLGSIIHSFPNMD